MTRIERANRDQAIAALRNDGLSLRDIGAQFGMSAENVRQRIVASSKPPRIPKPKKPRARKRPYTKRHLDFLEQTAAFHREMDEWIGRFFEGLPLGVSDFNSVLTSVRAWNTLRHSGFRLIDLKEDAAEKMMTVRHCGVKTALEVEGIVKAYYTLAEGR